MGETGFRTQDLSKELEEQRKRNEDLMWIAEIRAGQRGSFSHIVRKYQKGLLRLTLRFVKDLATAEDVVQEAFMKAYERLDTFEGRSGFRSWLFQIAVNTAKNKLRERRDGHSDIEMVQLSVPAVAEENMQHAALEKLMRTSVDQLPLKQRTALVLRVYEDMSFKEIAEIMDCPYDTAKANYRHALLKLKDEFESEADMRSWNFDEGGLFEVPGKRTEVET